jgi:aspartate aminotransferase
MSGRIIEMRKALFDALVKKGTPGTWNHIVDQIGMFSFTGLNRTQVKVLKENYHVYLTDNGRISMAGLNTSNVQYFAGMFVALFSVFILSDAVDYVVRNVRDSAL